MNRTTEEPQAVTTGLHDLSAVPLGDLAQAVLDGDDAITTALRRLAPRRNALLPAAGFQSAI